MVLLTPPESPRAIVPLTFGDVAGLPISWRSKLDQAEIRQALQRAPGASVWNPDTLEYAIATPWRNRPDVIQVADLAAVRDPEEMVRGLAAAAAVRGALQTVIVEIDEKRPESFYVRSGFEHIEQVVTFRMDARYGVRPSVRPEMRFVSVHPFDEQTLSTLVRLDHAAFPWIWWNSEAEFLTYAVLPGVALSIGYDGDTPVSYIGVTMSDDWGHIDRIAVDPARQGNGYGLQTLAATIEAMARRGVRSVGLSTQSTNERSQRLYLKFGFERSRDTDYDLWGDILHRAPGLDLHANDQPLLPPER